MPTKRPPGRQTTPTASAVSVSTKPSLKVPKEIVLIRGALVGPLLDAMRDIDPEENVTVVHEFGSFPGRESMPARDWISSLEKVVALERDGFLTIDAAAQLLAEAYPQTRTLKTISQLAVASVGTHPQARRLARDPALFPLPEKAVAREDIDLVKVTEVDEWFSSQGLPYQIQPLCSVLHSSSVAPPEHQSLEATDQRRSRRLARFHELGGRMRKVGNTWQTDPRAGRRGALAQLEREEKATDRPSAGNKEIRIDLAAACDRAKDGRS